MAEVVVSRGGWTDLTVPTESNPGPPGATGSSGFPRVQPGRPGPTGPSGDISPDIKLSPTGGDDRPLIQEAFDTAESSDIGRIVLRGHFLISDTLYIREGFQVIGEGFGDDTVSASQPTVPRTSITWTGSNAGTTPMIQVMSATVGQSIWGGTIDEIALRGNNTAYGSLRLVSTRSYQVGRIWVERCRNYLVQIDNENGGTSSETGWDSIRGTVGTDAACVACDGVVVKSIGVTGLTHIRGGVTNLTVVNGDGLYIGDCDESDFRYAEVSGSGTSRGLVFGGKGRDGSAFTRGQNNYSRKCRVHGAHGFIYAEVGSRNTIISPVNSESSGVIVRPGAVLNYSAIDRNTGKHWQAWRAPFNLELPLPVRTGGAITGTPALAAAGTALEGVAFDGASVERWSWLVGRRRDITGLGLPNDAFSRITGVRIEAIKSATALSGNVLLEVGFLTVPDGSSPSGAATVETFLHAVRAVGTQTVEQFTYTLVNPFVVQEDAGTIFRLARLGNDATDTYDAADYLILHVSLLITNDVAPSDNANRNITAATNANPVVVTCGNHGFINDQIVRIKSVTGMTEINNRYYLVTGVTVGGQTTLSLKTLSDVNVDGTGYGIYTGPSGTLELVNRMQVSDDIIT